MWFVSVHFGFPALFSVELWQETVSRLIASLNSAKKTRLKRNFSQTNLGPNGPQIPPLLKPVAALAFSLLGPLPLMRARSRTKDPVPT